MIETDYQSNLYEDHGMVREYDSHRIPDDAVVDWDNEYLTYCHRCHKDLLISIELPKMIYYCRNCREEILVETGQVHAAPVHKSNDEFIFSRMRKISSSTKHFNRAIIATLFALLALVLAAALELSKVKTFKTTLWIGFSIFAIIAIVHLVIAILQKIAQKKEKTLSKDDIGYEKLNGN